MKLNMRTIEGSLLAEEKNVSHYISPHHPATEVYLLFLLVTLYNEFTKALVV